jgi:uncharacterized protein (TIGR00252 family)
MNKRKKGSQYEAFAAEYLERQGYRMKDRNVYGPGGEIDLVAERDGMLVFVEVKMRSGTEYGSPLEAITAEKRRRILKTARYYLSRTPPPETGIRFDAIAITLEAGLPRIEHIENAFSVGEEEAFWFPGTSGKRLEKKNLLLDGHSLVYREMGRGALTCLFLHGFPTNGLLWRKAMPQVAGAGFRCIAPDQFGLGESDGPPGGDYSVGAQANVLRQAIQRLSLRNVVLIGHDTGGAVAQLYAARWPEEVRGLVLTNSVAFRAWPVSIVRLMKMALKLGAGKIVLHPRWGRSMACSRMGFPAGFTEPESLTPEIAELYLEPLLRNAFRREQVRRYILAMDNRHTRGLGRELKEFSQPVLAAWAEGDRMLSPSIGKRLANLFPRGEYLNLAQGGHFHPEEFPEQIAEAVAGFLKKIEI